MGSTAEGGSWYGRVIGAWVIEDCGHWAKGLVAVELRSSRQTVSHALFHSQGDRGFDGQPGSKGDQGEKGERVS